MDPNIVHTTVRLLLEPTEEQVRMILERSEVIRQITNRAIELNIEDISQHRELHKALYQTLKFFYPASATMDINCVERRVAAMFKSIKTRRHNIEKKIKDLTEQGKPIYPSTLKQYEHICTTRPHVKPDEYHTLPLTSQQCRWVFHQGIVYLHGFNKSHPTPVKFHIDKYAQQQLQLAHKVGDCKICKHGKKWFIHLTLIRVVPSITNLNSEVLGVDSGIKNLITTSSGLMISGDDTWAHGGKIMKLRSALQARGTRSAKKHLRRTTGRYKNFINDQLHCVSKRVVQEAIRKGYGAIALEHIKMAVNEIRNPHLRKAIAKWNFGRLRELIYYKAKLAGIAVYFVSASHTSTTCFHCGYNDELNRPTQTNFICQMCGYVQHADYNAALNIAVRGKRRLIEVLTPKASVKKSKGPQSIGLS